ncbi:MAG: hypothetical protein NVSMB3_07790 [Acidobacteriaceae bacterium]
MRARGWLGSGLMGLALLVCARGGETADGWAAPVAARCSRAVVEGEVRSGEEFRRGFAAGLEVVLEPVAAGWVLRVTPAGVKRMEMDYAGMATPPYRSVSPLLVSTDFGFRAQDAVGWNPRRFRYAADARAFGSMEAAYRRVTATPRAPAADEEALAGLVSRQPEGELAILDASLTPGTADQTRAAGLVATHFGTTAHRIEQPADGRATAAGRIGWMRFRVRLDLAGGERALRGVKVESHACGGG